jgi:TonB family protein
MDNPLRMRQVLIALLLTASTAHAENWLQLAKLDGKGSGMFVDTASINTDSEMRKAWFKFVYAADRPIGSGYGDVAPGVQSYRWELKLGHFNCADRTTANSQSILNSADNQVVGKIAVDPSTLKFRRVGLQSAEGILLLTVCSWSTPDEQPGPGSASVTIPAAPDLFYPQGSKRRGEQGAPLVEACVGPSGKLLRNPEVVVSSGFREIDAAAIKVAKASRYKAGTEDGVPLPESCIKFKVRFLVSP